VVLASLLPKFTPLVEARAHASIWDLTAFYSKNSEEACSCS